MIAGTLYLTGAIYIAFNKSTTKCQNVFRFGRPQSYSKSTKSKFAIMQFLWLHLHTGSFNFRLNYLKIVWVSAEAAGGCINTIFLKNNMAFGSFLNMHLHIKVELLPLSLLGNRY